VKKIDWDQVERASAALMSVTLFICAVTLFIVIMVGVFG
jgi:hypothetical protein